MAIDYCNSQGYWFESGRRSSTSGNADSLRLLISVVPENSGPDHQVVGRLTAASSARVDHRAGRSSVASPGA